MTTLRSGLCYRKSVCLSVVCNVRARYWGVETFDNISSPFCTLAIRWPCKILRRSSQGNPSVGVVKRKIGSKTQRCHVRLSFSSLDEFLGKTMQTLQYRCSGRVVYHSCLVIINGSFRLEQALESQVLGPGFVTIPVYSWAMNFLYQRSPVRNSLHHCHGR